MGRIWGVGLEHLRLWGLSRTRAKRKGGGAGVGRSLDIALCAHIRDIVGFFHVLLAVAITLGLVGAVWNTAVVVFRVRGVLVVLVALALLFGWPAVRMVLA